MLGILQRATGRAARLDLADREKDIHWPGTFNPSQADLFSHNALLINASCERIWGHIVDATEWPQWYPNSKGVRIQPPRPSPKMSAGWGEAAIASGHQDRRC